MHPHHVEAMNDNADAVRGDAGRNLDYSRYLDTQKTTDHPHLLAVLDDLLNQLGLGRNIPSPDRELSRGLSNVVCSERPGSEPPAEELEAAGAERRPPSRSTVELPSAPLLRVRGRDLDLYRHHAQRILLDLLEAALLDREGWIRYRRDRNAYRPGEVLHARGFSYDAVVNIVNAMKPGKLGWIEHADGYYLLAAV